MITISSDGYLKKAWTGVAKAVHSKQRVDFERMELERKVYDTEGITIPRSLKYSSRFEDNSIDLVRKRLRLNHISHKKYDS
jgi:hypothetical protein